jgi:hypothetical protein
MSSYQDTILSISGAVVFQQGCTYWLKTIIKNQYVKGTDIKNTVSNLLKNKDRFRLYRGFVPTTMETLISRNTDILFHKFYSKNLNSSKEEIAVCSGLSSSFIKFVFLPFDTVSNIYQVHGKEASEIIQKQHKKENYFFYRGALPQISIGTIGSSAWLYTYSILNDMKFSCNKNINNAIIGIGSSVVSDLVVNPIRIIKTYKQSNCDYISYNDIIKRIVKEDKNLLKSVFRGFGLRTSLNAFNSGLFLVIWKNLE